MADIDGSGISGAINGAWVVERKIAYQRTVGVNASVAAVASRVTPIRECPS